MARNPLANPEPLIRRVYAYVAYRIGAGPDAEDITSETFERALRGSGTYDPARGEPVAWLIGIARRCLSDAIAGRLATVAEPPDRADRADMEERTVARLTLAAAMATLDERDQDLLALRYGGDLTAQRIGEILGLETNAVEVALHRALARLRDRLEPQDSGAAAAGPEALTVEP